MREPEQRKFGNGARFQGERLGGDLERLTAICEDAARACGADWVALRSRIREEIGRLPPEQQLAMAEDVRLTLAVASLPDDVAGSRH